MNDDTLVEEAPGSTTEEIVDYTKVTDEDIVTNLLLRIARLESMVYQMVPVLESTSGWMAGVTTNRARRRSVAMKARKGGRGAYAGKPGRGSDG